MWRTHAFQSVCLGWSGYDYFPNYYVWFITEYNLILFYLGRSRHRGNLFFLFSSRTTIFLTIFAFVQTNTTQSFGNPHSLPPIWKPLVISLKTLIRFFFFTFLNNLVSFYLPQQPSLTALCHFHMFSNYQNVSTLPVVFYFFQIKRIVESGMCNNSTIFQFLHPCSFKSTNICLWSWLSSFDLWPVLKKCVNICKHEADDLKMTPPNWKNSKGCLGSSQNISLNCLLH